MQLNEGIDGALFKEASEDSLLPLVMLVKSADTFAEEIEGMDSYTHWLASFGALLGLLDSTGSDISADADAASFAKVFASEVL